MGRTMNDAAKWWYYVRQNGGYYPQTVANLGYDVWDWDANRKTGYINGEETTLLWQDSAKTTPVTTNGHPVGAWVDGVQGVDAIQATTANKPTYATASLNGLPTLSFDGGDLLATANISISTFALWVVYKYTSGFATAIVEQSGNIAAGFGSRLSQGTSIVARGGVSSTKTFTSTTGAFVMSRVEAQGTNASHKIFENSAELTIATNPSTGDYGAGTSTFPLYIGARAGLFFPFTGNIAHLCIVSPYPTPAIIASMESYINGIWGVY